MSEFNEPWSVWHGRIATDIDNDGAVIICERPHPSGGKYQKKVDANFRRIVACVNVCGGISTDALESGATMANLIQQRDAYAAERDSLREQVERQAGQIERLREALRRFVTEGANLEPQKRYLWQEAREALAAAEPAEAGKGGV